MNPIYCSKKTGNSSHCSELAVYNGKFISKDNPIDGKVKWYPRCKEHRTTSTAKKVWVEDKVIDQSLVVSQTLGKLRDYIGKPVHSSFHRQNGLTLIGVYIKALGIMCQNTKTKKWLYVYSHQIRDFNI